MRATAFTVHLALATVAALASGCDEGSAASPTFDSVEGGAVVDATVDAGPTYAICPDGMDATFGSIYTLMLSKPSSQTGCGSANPTGCHSTVGSSAANAGTLLDFSLDASAVYAELLGPDGGGQRAANVDDFNNHVLRVVPFDAGASMLYIKLTIGPAATDGAPTPYGSGMPYNDPGSVCPAAVQAVADWINGGATELPVEAGAEGGGDASGDATANDGGDAGSEAAADAGPG
jgi:hypothetical protein